MTDTELILAELAALRAEIAALRGAPARATLTVPETATILGCAKTRVFELLSEGALARGKKSGRKTMVTRDSIDAYLRQPSYTKAPAQAVETRTGSQMRAEYLKMTSSSRQR